jgi:YggT family protein
MAGIGAILALILNLFTLALVGRLVLDYIRVFSPSWRPTGFILWLATTIYAITDPAVNFVRKFVPPLRLGSVALDLSFIVIFVAVQILGRIVMTIF